MPASVDLFRALPSTRCFIETGTHDGAGVACALAAGFMDIRTVELASHLALSAQARFCDQPQVRVFEGSSLVWLPQMISDLDAPATFWLDAHYSGGETAFGPAPLRGELEIIAAHAVKGHTVLIDDVRLLSSEFGTSRPEVETILRRAHPYRFQLMLGGDARFGPDVLVALP